MRQALKRTSARLLLRRELWNGNRESLRAVLSLDPERSILAWAWAMHGTYDADYEALRADAPPGQQWVVLRSRRDVDEFLVTVDRSRRTGR